MPDGNYLKVDRGPFDPASAAVCAFSTRWVIVRNFQKQTVQFVNERKEIFRLLSNCPEVLDLLIRLTQPANPSNAIADLANTNS